MKKSILFISIFLMPMVGYAKAAESSYFQERAEALQRQNDALLEMVNEKRTHKSIVVKGFKYFLKETWDVIKSHLKSWVTTLILATVFLLKTGLFRMISTDIIFNAEISSEDAEAVKDAWDQSNKKEEQENKYNEYYEKKFGGKSPNKIKLTTDDYNE